MRDNFDGSYQKNRKPIGGFASAATPPDKNLRFRNVTSPKSSTLS
jgi:hypothetical protein